MIDTIFFLLVFFMITSLSMVKMKGMGVNLPKDSSPSTKMPPKLIVTVDAQGKYFLGTQPITEDQLQPDLQAEVTAKPDSVIIVNVSGSRQVQTLITVMDAVGRVNTPAGDPAAVMIASQMVDASGHPIDQTAPGAIQ